MANRLAHLGRNLIAATAIAALSAFAYSADSIPKLKPYKGRYRESKITLTDLMNNLNDDEELKKRPESHVINGIKFVPQGRLPFCGVCTTKMMLNYWKIDDYKGGRNLLVFARDLTRADPRSENSKKIARMTDIQAKHFSWIKTGGSKIQISVYFKKKHLNTGNYESFSAKHLEKFMARIEYTLSKDIPLEITVNESGSHVVLASGYDSNTVHVYDSAKGKKKISKRRFKNYIYTSPFNESYVAYFFKTFAKGESSSSSKVANDLGKGTFYGFCKEIEITKEELSKKKEEKETMIVSMYGKGAKPGDYSYSIRVMDYIHSKYLLLRTSSEQEDKPIKDVNFYILFLDGKTSSRLSLYKDGKFTSFIPFKKKEKFPSLYQPSKFMNQLLPKEFLYE